jgi:hypothetical protein
MTLGKLVATSNTAIDDIDSEYFFTIEVDMYLVAAMAIHIYIYESV